ncbi:hypothetical protein [Fortiea contorta]|uniref:hypothetical protein n=1 Tax=Fortiea contorta TaxID=1892405 RepID=UPI0003790D85|nr:hypothetical protein [Fortiea contorta]
MARPIERIERDITVLQEAIGVIATELHSAYASYLTTLGQAVRQQLILATYHLCTQGYPVNFLKLSLNQRQQLQQTIRKLGQRAIAELLSSIEDEEDEEAELADGESEASNSPPDLALVEISNPIELVTWQQNLEEVMQNTLKKVSHDANVVLQKAGVLPKKLPEPILEAAAAVSEASAEVMPGPPNLLNLVIEIENEQDADDSTLTQIMAINLRLGEIEFADATLSAGRKHIRHILNQLNKVGREYQKKQQEKSIAEAEAAWRAIWADD